MYSHLLIRGGSLYGRTSTRGLGFVKADQCEGMHKTGWSRISEIALLLQPHEIDFEILKCEHLTQYNIVYFFLSFWLFSWSTLTKPWKTMIVANVLYNLPWTAVTKHQKLSDSKQQKCIASQFWKVEVWNQGISRAMLSLMTLGENPSSPLLASAVCCQSLPFFGF